MHMISPMRLIIVAVASSVHTARALEPLADTGWDIRVFDSQRGMRPHRDIPAFPVHTAQFYDMQGEEGVKFTQVRPPEGATYKIEDRARQLNALIDEFEPDLIHSHELQHSGALVDLARRERGGRLPCPWIQTCWGSDISMYPKHVNYVDRVRSICRAVDYMGGECHRDIALARAMGFKGQSVGVWPVAGGMDLDRVRSLRRPGPASARRTVTVKGVVGSVARGDVALAALERVGPRLEGYEVCTYQTTEKLLDGFRETVERNGGTYVCLSFGDARQVPHETILAAHGRSRVSLALNDSDAMSTSFMEAMALGSFPVHSKGSCGYEVTPAGRGAIFVSATDPDEVADAVCRALDDDELVDKAQEINTRSAEVHFDRARIAQRVIDMYERIWQHAAMGVAA